MAHGLTTMPGMLSVLDAALAGGLAAAVTVAVGGDGRLALVLAIVAAVSTMLALMALGLATFARQSRYLEARFPAPGRAD